MPNGPMKDLRTLLDTKKLSPKPKGQFNRLEQCAQILVSITARRQANFLHSLADVSSGMGDGSRVPKVCAEFWRGNVKEAVHLLLTSAPVVRMDLSRTPRLLYDRT